MTSHNRHAIDQEILRVKQQGKDYWLEGPVIAIIGWIPFLTDLQGTNYARVGGAATRLAMRLMFLSGNPKIPRSLPTDVEFQRLVKSKEYRFVLRLQNRLLCNAKGEALAIIGDTQSHVGYTPLRFPGSTVTLRYSQGQQRDFEAESYTLTSGTIAHRTAVKMGGFPNLGNYVLTGAWAPYAWVHTNYTMHSNGQVDFDFSGTLIPNHSHFFDGRPMGDHDMLGISEREITSFWTAGNGTDAPGRLIADGVSYSTRVIV